MERGTAFEKNFKKFVHEILKNLFVDYEMHNYSAGNLIGGIISPPPKKTLSIDGSYLLSLHKRYDSQKTLIAGQGYSPNYPTTLLGYLTYFGEYNVEWTGLCNKKGAFEINQKFDFIYTRIDDNNFGFSYMNNSYYAGFETDTSPDLYIDTIEQTYKALNKSGTAIFFIENQFLYENVNRVKQLVDRSFLSGAINLRNYTLLILKKHSKNTQQNDFWRLSMPSF